jgi:hypothetical protein
MTSRRIYINEFFSGLVNLYKNCPDDTSFTNNPNSIKGLNVYTWILYQGFDEGRGNYYVLTSKKECMDCTLRGTLTRPEFWEDFE